MTLFAFILCHVEKILVSKPFIEIDVIGLGAQSLSYSNTALRFCFKRWRLTEDASMTPFRHGHKSPE